MIAHPARSYRFHGGTARVSAWHGRPDVAVVALQGTAMPSARALSHLLDCLRRDGVRDVMTNALGPGADTTLLDAGFEVRHRLHLLERDLAHLSDLEATDGTIDAGPVTAREHASLLAIDAACFDEFWRFDDVALAEAIAATPRAEVLAVPGTGTPLAYGIFGLGTTTGYVQRLAVMPDARRRGLARGLLAVGLRHLRDLGATNAYVNTQADNDVALDLYLRSGFVRLPVGLCILGRSL